MTGFLRKLFAKSADSKAAESAPRGEAAAAGVQEDERIEDLYEEFCRTFCFRPGVNFMDFLKAEGVTRMIEWLHWSTPEPEPKAFIRMAVDATRKGIHIWEKEGIFIYHEGDWERGGGPSRESQDALSILAQILEQPIKVYYTEKQDGPLMVMEFEP